MLPSTKVTSSVLAMFCKVGVPNATQYRQLALGPMSPVQTTSAVRHQIKRNPSFVTCEKMAKTYMRSVKRVKGGSGHHLNVVHTAAAWAGVEFRSFP